MNASSKLSKKLRRGNAVHLLALHELDRQPVRVAALNLVEHGDRLDEESLAPLPVAKSIEPSTTKHGAPGSKPLAYAFDNRPRAKRKAAQIEVDKLQ